MIIKRRKIEPEKKNYYNKYNPSSEDLQMAFVLFFTKNGEISYYELSSFDEVTEGVILASPEISPEKSYERKEAFENLSAEAKEMINTIVKAPAEVLEMITTSTFGIYSKTLIRRYFYDHKGWKHKKIEKAFDEITAYVNALE